MEKYFIEDHMSHHYLKVAKHVKELQIRPFGPNMIIDRPRTLDSFVH